MIFSYQIHRVQRGHLLINFLSFLWVYLTLENDTNIFCSFNRFSQMFGMFSVVITVSNLFIPSFMYYPVCPEFSQSATVDMHQCKGSIYSCVQRLVSISLQILQLTICNRNICARSLVTHKNFINQYKKWVKPINDPQICK